MSADQIIKTRHGANAERWKRAIQEKALAKILDLPLVETKSDHFLAALDQGTVSTNVYLRRLHNFALGYGWLPAPVLPPKFWPKVKHRPKRAITRVEHEKIIAREGNAERRAFYELLWELGGSQSDVANLTNDDVDWNRKTISYFRAKTGQPAKICFDEDVEKILRQLPSVGPLFPYLRRVLAKHRATEFKQRCQGLGIEGVSLHSYRYSWAERAREAGYPERSAQEVLGHGSNAVHRAYARLANPELVTIGTWQKRQKASNLIPVQFNQSISELASTSR